MIGVEINRVVYKGDGQAKEFPFSFTILEKSEIIVTLVSPNQEKTELTSDYFVDMDKKEVVYPGYSPGEEPAESERPSTLPQGWYLVIQRKVAINQQTSLGDKWPFDVTEDALDKITRILQDINTNADRHLALSPEVDGVDATIPKPEPNKCFYWDETGKKLISADNPNLAAKNAKESESNAKSYMNRAETAAAGAEEARTKAETAEANALSSESKAKESANYAAESATAAANSKANIELHEKNSAASAASAAKSAEDAYNSKVEAGQKAEEAAQYDESAKGWCYSADEILIKTKKVASTVEEYQRQVSQSESDAKAYAQLAAKWAEAEGTIFGDYHSAKYYATNAITFADAANKSAQAAANNQQDAANSESAAKEYAKLAARWAESTGIIGEKSHSAKYHAETSEYFAEVAQELYRRYCVDIVGPPPSAMNQADLFVAPGPAAMASNDS